MPVVNDCDDDADLAPDVQWRLDQLIQGRRLLWAAVAAVVVIFVAIGGKSMAATGLTLIGWLASILAAIGGISKVAAGTDSNAVVKIGSFVLALMPPFNLIPLIYFLGRAQGAIGRAKEDVAQARLAALARERNRRRAASAPAAAAAMPARPAPPTGSAPLIPPAPATQRRPADAIPSPPTSPSERAAAAQRLAGAVARVKMAGMSGQQEGQELRVSIGLPDMEMPEREEPVVRVCSGEFAVMYSIDEGQHFTYVNRGELRAAGISLDDLHRIGLVNLIGKVNDGKPGLTVLPQNGFHGLVMGGDFEASLVLLDDLWDGPLKQYTPNGCVVTVPARDMCAFCDTGSAPGIAELRAISQRVTEGGSALVSDKLFVREAGKWREYVGGARADLAPLEFKL